MMEEKQADNKIYELPKEIKQIDSAIDIVKNNLKDLDQTEENFINLNKSIKKCSELLGESIKGGNIQNELSSINSESNHVLKQSVSMLDERRTEYKNQLKELEIQRDIEFKKFKEEINKDNNKEEKETEEIKEEEKEN